MVDVKRVELASDKQKVVDRTRFDQWKDGRDYDAPHPSGAASKKASRGGYFLVNEVKEFLILKQDFMSVHEYGMKCTQLCRYVLQIVKGMKSRMSLFVAGSVYFSSKKDRDAMLKRDMDISRLIIYVQQVQ